jgi:hypothetical protein
MTEAIYKSRIAALEEEIAVLYKAASDATRENMELRQLFPFHPSDIFTLP